MIINKKSQTELSSFYVIYNGSVLNENVKNYGISHLIEHCQCKQFKHLYNEFDRYSISWNAYTSSDKIVFYMVGIDEYVNKFKQEFLESLLNFDITEEEFLLEKNVVIQEYKDVFQDQSSSLYFNLLRKEFKNYSAIGKLESLNRIDYNDLKNYWENFSSKPSMIINVSKFNDFEGYDDFGDYLPSSYIPDEEDELLYETKMDFNKSCILGYIKVENPIPYAKITYVLSMLSMTMLSPFWNEIREKRGLTYNIDTSSQRISNSQFIFMTQVVTTDELVDDVLDTYKMILENIDDYLTLEQFNIIKDYFIVKRKFNEIETYKNVGKFMTPEVFQIDSILDTITYEECKEIFNEYLTYDKWCWVVDKKDFK